MFRRNQKENPRQLKAYILSAIVSSIVFAICHFQFNIGAFFVFGFGGLIGSWIYYSTNNLFYGIILHGFFQFSIAIIKVYRQYCQDSCIAHNNKYHCD
ncbi:MAG: CPBP family intramembrane metalloprotease [Saprospiraceae bacterium]|nr:CPBP family intramembrane metalloprotease [Saprospiraceae bacterium]